jgi:hypothetical protein
MAADPKHPPGPPMDLENMREQGVHHFGRVHASTKRTGIQR